MIKAFDKPDFSGSALAEFQAFVNPGEITLAYEMEYDSAQGAGTTGSRMEFKKIKPGDMSLTFFIDGTGANGTQADVQDTIASFQEVTGYNGKIHRTTYLKVMWGKLQVRRCVLKSASIAYKLFHPNGVPLRAVITATFTDASDDQTRVAIQQDQSADLTHVRVVKAGETLPGLCDRVYGEPRWYLAVARFNRLDGFRALAPGTRLVLPPPSGCARWSPRWPPRSRPRGGSHPRGAHPPDPRGAPRVHRQGRRRGRAPRAPPAGRQRHQRREPGGLGAAGVCRRLGLGRDLSAQQRRHLPPRAGGGDPGGGGERSRHAVQGRRGAAEPEGARPYRAAAGGGVPARRGQAHRGPQERLLARPDRRRRDHRAAGRRRRDRRRGEHRRHPPAAGAVRLHRLGLPGRPRRGQRAPGAHHGRGGGGEGAGAERLGRGVVRLRRHPAGARRRDGRPRPVLGREEPHLGPGAAGGGGEGRRRPRRSRAGERGGRHAGRRGGARPPRPGARGAAGGGGAGLGRRAVAQVADEQDQRPAEERGDRHRGPRCAGAAGRRGRPLRRDGVRHRGAARLRPGAGMEDARAVRRHGRVARGRRARLGAARGGAAAGGRRPAGGGGGRATRTPTAKHGCGCACRW